MGWNKEIIQKKVTSEIVKLFVIVKKQKQRKHFSNGKGLYRYKIFIEKYL